MNLPWPLLHVLCLATAENAIVGVAWITDCRLPEAFDEIADDADPGKVTTCECCCNSELLWIALPLPPLPLPLDEAAAVAAAAAAAAAATAAKVVCV